MGESEVHTAPAGRTQRVHIAMPAVAHARNFRETSSAVAVNGHGCLVNPLVLCPRMLPS